MVLNPILGHGCYYSICTFPMRAFWHCVLFFYLGHAIIWKLFLIPNIDRLGVPMGPWINGKVDESCVS
jgi:hypothetical protein